NSNTVKTQEQTWEGPNLKATVTVQVRDMDKPVTYQTTLVEWFTGRNPNWRTRPAYMLRKNALSKVMEEVAPLGTEADEAPPLSDTEVHRVVPVVREAGGARAVAGATGQPRLQAPQEA